MLFDILVNQILKEGFNNNHFIIKGDDEILEPWQIEQSDRLILSDDEIPEGTEEIAPLIYKSSPSLLTVEIEGLDPSVDGRENFYIVRNPKVLDTIASFFEDKIVSADRDEYETSKTFGAMVREGQVEFSVHLGKSGFTGEDTGYIKVYLYKQGSINILKNFLINNA